MMLYTGIEEIHKNVLRRGGGLIYFLGIFLIPSLPAFKFRSLAKGRLSISVGGGGASDDGPAAGSENEERDGNPFIYQRP